MAITAPALPTWWEASSDGPDNGIGVSWTTWATLHSYLQAAANEAMWESNSTTSNSASGLSGGYDKMPNKSGLKMEGCVWLKI